MGNSVRILICENDETYAGRLRDALARAYDVSLALTVDESLALLADSRERTRLEDRIAVAVIDLSFRAKGSRPGVEGFEILEEAIKDPFLEPIIFTGTGDESKASEASTKGAFRYVMKSGVTGAAGMQALVAAIESAVGCRTSLIALQAAIDQWAVQPPSGNSLLRNLETVFGHIQRIRGRAV